MSEYVQNEMKVIRPGDSVDIIFANESKLRHWWRFKADKVLWRKQIYHDHLSLVDEWGTSTDPDNCYEFDISIDKVFSLKHGFSYQVKAPNVLINDKYLLDAVGELFRYLYKGGCPCYFRLEDELIRNGMWRKL